MLAAIAHIFGWIPEDWNTDKKDGRYKSDFAWASGGGFQPPSPSILEQARDLLPPHPAFAGTIAFLPATPNRDPHLELDVVTPHHTAYYERKAGFEDAPDTEDPIPVFFPAIAPQKDGDYFTFPLLPLQRGRVSCPRVFGTTPPVQIARLWLSHGLELFGLGAKTNAGYGWFEINTRISSRLETEKRQREEAKSAASIDPCPEVIALLVAMTEQQLAGILNAYSFEPKFWPKDKSPLFEVTLLHHVLVSASQLRQSKKGGKAIELLAAKYNRPLP